MARIVDHQTKFVSSLLGGPAHYTDEQIHRMHRHLDIGGRHFDRLKEILAETLEDHDFAPRTSGLWSPPSRKGGTSWWSEPMSIAAINEQLLRAIGVGVALLDLGDLRFRFHNDTFAEWFGTAETGRPLSDLFPDLDLGVLREALAQDGRYNAEVTFRPRRRTMTVALAFNRALDGTHPIAVLVCQNITRIKELESMIDSYSMMVERNTREIKREKEQVETAAPQHDAPVGLRGIPHLRRRHAAALPQVSVLSLDFSGFLGLTRDARSRRARQRAQRHLHRLRPDRQQFGCERIKTVGDVYITMAGVPDRTDDHAANVANAALRFLRYLGQRNATHPVRWSCRIGLASGSVIGSVVGVQKYLYDVFGPAVFRAARLRHQARPMSILAGPEILTSLGDGFRSVPEGEADLGDEVREAIYSLEPAPRSDAAFA
jgi:adenylate cyclase